MPAEANMAVGESCTCPIATASTGRPADRSAPAAAGSRYGKAALTHTIDTVLPARFVSVPSSRTVGESTSPRTANTEERPSLARTRSPAQSSTGCSGPR